MGWWGWWPLLLRHPLGDLAPVPPPPPEPLIETPPLPEVDVIRRGESATRLLADPTLAGAFADVRAEAYRLWLESGPLDIAKREEMYRVIHALEMVRAQLVQYRSDMIVKVAEHEAEARAA
jgi:hypothetical protein